MKKIAIIYTTFIRPELVKQTLPGIVGNIDEDSIVLVGDQGKEEDNVYDICSKMNNTKIKYYKLDFDCGLSAGRNILVQKAKELDIKYCLIMADSITLNTKYDFQSIIDFLESNELYGDVGFDLKGRICWECDIELIKNKGFLLDIPRKESIIYKGRKFQEVDLHRNFFIAKTEALLNTKWDEELKILEHEDHAYRWKHNPIHYKRFYTDSILGQYIDFKPNTYNKYRNRMRCEFMTVLQKKYNITGWVTYSADLRKAFNDYKLRNT